MKLYSVILPHYFEPLTYGSHEEMKPGSLVAVPFRTKVLRGVIARELKESPVKPKEIQEILVNLILEKWQIDLLDRISEYYFCSKNQALKLFLPGGVLRQKKMEAPTRKSKKKEEPKTKTTKPKTLTGEQKTVLETIRTSDKQKFLIHGITGSGKTEIYLQLAKKAASEGKGVIILVPEISLTPQLTAYFVENFPEIVVWHSRLTEAEKRHAWWKLREGKSSIVLGSRSALFAPVKNPGLIIVDEEHEWTYKQENAPRYHARTVAEMMCELDPTMKLVLGSATPDGETYHRAKEGKYELLEIKQRASNASSESTPLPEITIVDLRDEFKKRNFSIFSELLQEKLRETLERNEQAILFLNRRGSASAVVCRECGYTTRCPSCDIAMTLHGDGMNAKLLCHHCGQFDSPPVTCPTCKSTYIKEIGTGTQKVELEAKKMFPNARILRADKDSTTSKDGFENIYNAVKNHEADILIGTQMIAKGLDLPKVSLVGVILADVSLHIPDFRSSERTFQLLTQVAGRAGRRDRQGEVIIQTYLPEHPSIVAAKNHDYLSFHEQEMKERALFRYPPFENIIKLTHENPSKEKCFQEAKRLYDMICDANQVNKWGLTINFAPASITKLHNKYRWHIYLSGDHPEALLKQIEMPRGWKVDRDPMSLG